MRDLIDHMGELEHLNPVADEPVVVVAGWGRNHLYYFEVDHFPEFKEYQKIGVRLADTMLATIGQYPQRWYLIEAAAFEVEHVRHVLEREPIRVS